MKKLKYLLLITSIMLLATACTPRPPEPSITTQSIPSPTKQTSSIHKGKVKYPIYPVSYGWKPAKVVDVQAVARSVASVLLPNFPEKTLAPIIMRNEEAGPRTLYKRGKNNEYIILVDIKDTYWAKLSYQFSHELGHILSNYANESGRNQWFEEALMETVSLYTLDKMSTKWQYNPPYPNWKSYSSALKEYLNNILNEKHRIVNTDLSTWYQKNKNSLRNDPYIRDKNEVLATAIYRFIQEGKFRISTIQYLNLGTPDKDKPFSTYLREWYENSPEENRESVLNVIELLGIAI